MQVVLSYAWFFGVLKCAEVSLCLVWALVVGHVDTVCMATLNMVDTDHSLAVPLMVCRALHQNLAAPQGWEGEAEAEGEDSLEVEVGDILEVEVEDTQEVGAEDMPWPLQYYPVSVAAGSLLLPSFLPFYSRKSTPGPRKYSSLESQSIVGQCSNV